METNAISIRSGPHSSRIRINYYPGEWLSEAFELAKEESKISIRDLVIQTGTTEVVDNIPNGLSIRKGNDEHLTVSPKVRRLRADSSQRPVGKPTRRGHTKITDLYEQEEQD